MRALVMVAAALLAACGPAEKKPDAAPEGADVVAPRNPFFGTWEMTNAKIAPWWDQKGETPEASPDFAKLVFHPDKSSGNKMVECNRPRYSVSIVPPRGLFEGNLPNAPAYVSEAGFRPGDITSMNFGCLDPASDVSLDFPMYRDDVIMLGLDNVIYTFKRTGD